MPHASPCRRIIYCLRRFPGTSVARWSLSRSHNVYIHILHSEMEKDGIKPERNHPFSGAIEKDRAPKFLVSFRRPRAVRTDVGRTTRTRIPDDDVARVGEPLPLLRFLLSGPLSSTCGRSGDEGARTRSAGLGMHRRCIYLTTNWYLVLLMKMQFVVFFFFLVDVLALPINRVFIHRDIGTDPRKSRIPID